MNDYKMKDFDENELKQGVLSLISRDDFSELLMDALNLVEENSLTLDKIDIHYETCNDELKEILDSYKEILSGETEQMLEMIRDISSVDKTLMH